MSINSDTLSREYDIRLEDLNSEATSIEDVRAQLELAKKYIRRVQQKNAATPTVKTSTNLLVSSSSSSSKTKSYSSLASSDADSKGVSNSNGRMQNLSIDDGKGNEPFLTKHESIGVRSDDDDDQVSSHPANEEMSPETYYLTPWWKLLMKRLPWLIALLLLQSFGALILNHYNKLIEQHLVLNFFIPMMQGTSGNAGNQPGVMVTRALSMGQLQFWVLVFKEGPVAIITGFVLGVVAYLRIRLVYPDDGASALSIALAIFLAIMLAVSLSIFFSIILHKITCCDPADGAVPLLSTVSDVMSILILMAIAQHLLPNPHVQ